MELALQKYFVAGYLSGAVSTFGGNVQRLQKAAGLKGKELAELVGVKPPTVSGWRYDKTGLPETPTLLKLAKAMRCTVDDLLKGVDAEYDELRAQQQQREGGTDVPATSTESDRLELKRYQHIVEETRRIAQSLINLVAGDKVQKQHRSAAPASPGVSRRDRKAG